MSKGGESSDDARKKKRRQSLASLKERRQICVYGRKRDARSRKKGKGKRSPFGIGRKKGKRKGSGVTGKGGVVRQIGKGKGKRRAID